MKFPIAIRYLYLRDTTCLPHILYRVISTVVSTGWTWRRPVLLLSLTTFGFSNRCLQSEQETLPTQN